jgi:hypothetical protein
MSLLTRRQWVVVAGTAPLAAQINTTAPPQSPPPAQSAVTPEQRIDKAKDDIQKVSRRLAEIEVPMNIEPAFHFSAH